VDETPEESNRASQEQQAVETNQAVPLENLFPNMNSSSSLSSLFQSSFYDALNPGDENLANMLDGTKPPDDLAKKTELIVSKPTLNDIEIEASFFKFDFNYVTRFFFYRDQKDTEFVSPKVMPHITYHVDRMKLNYTKEECTVVAIDMYHTTIIQQLSASSHIEKLIGKFYLVLEKNRVEKAVSFRDIAGNIIHIKLLRKKRCLI